MRKDEKQRKKQRERERERERRLKKRAEGKNTRNEKTMYSVSSILFTRHVDHI